MLPGAPTAQGVDRAGARQAAAQAPLLFVQTVERGRLYHDRSGRMFLRLGVSRWTEAFSDRPQREAGRERTSAFVRRWAARGFRSDPPNAALSIDARRPGADVVALRLSRPRYDASRGVLRYAVRPLRRTVGGALRRFARRADPVRLGRFGRAALFIDDAGVAEGKPGAGLIGVKGCSRQGQLSFTLSLSGGATFAFDEVLASPTLQLEVIDPTTVNIRYSGVADPACGYPVNSPFPNPVHRRGHRLLR